MLGITSLPVSNFRSKIENLGLGGAFRNRFCHLVALAEASFAPAVENSLDQMVRDGAIVGDILMTMFTFPGLLENPGYLLNCFCH